MTTAAAAAATIISESPFVVGDDEVEMVEVESHRHTSRRGHDKKKSEDAEATTKTSRRRSLKERASALKDDVMEGYHKGTGFLYAFRGIWFFVFNPSLWFVVVCPLACASFFSVLSVVLLLAFALPAQAHGLYNAIETAWFPMWLAWLIAVALTLLESAIVVMLLTQLLFNCYKGMLEERVFRLRGILMDDESTVAVACANVISQAVFAWLVMIVTIPLNLVPIVGNIIFFFLSGTVFAWNLHAAYFSSRDLSFGQQLKFVGEHWFDYMSFGFVCLALNMVPIINFFFIFTSMVGAALWAADLEKSKALVPYIEEQAEQAEAIERSRTRLRKKRIEEARRRRHRLKREREIRRKQRLLDSDASDSSDWTPSSDDESSIDSDSDTDVEKPKPKHPPTTTTTTSTAIPTETTKINMNATTPTTTTTTISSMLPPPFHHTSSTKSFPMMPMPTTTPSNRTEYEEIQEISPLTDAPLTESHKLLASPNTTVRFTSDISPDGNATP